MRYHSTSLVWLVLSGILLAGCKKASEPAASAPQATPPIRTSAPPAESIKAAAPKAALSGEAATLLIKWPVGNRYTFRMDLDQHSTNHIPMMPKPMQQDVTMSMTYAISVVTNTPTDGRELELEFLSNEMDMRMGGQPVLSFDSKEKDTDTAANPLSAPFRRMIGTKLRLQVDATGKVEQVLNLDEWQKGLANGASGPAGGMLAQQFSEGFFRQTVDFGKGLPGKPVQVGESWPFKSEVPAGPLGKVAVDSQVTFKGWEDRQQRHCAALQMAGTFTGSGGTPEMNGVLGKMSLEDGKAVGTSWLDPELGMLAESVADQTMRLKGDMPGMGGQKTPASFTVEIGQKVTTTLVEVGKLGPQSP